MLFMVYAVAFSLFKPNSNRIPKSGNHSKYGNVNRNTYLPVFCIITVKVYFDSNVDFTNIIFDYKTTYCTNLFSLVKNKNFLWCETCQDVLILIAYMVFF